MIRFASTWALFQVTRGQINPEDNGVCAADGKRDHCFGPSCGIKLPGDLDASSICECNDRDIGYSFTPCKDNKHDIVYFWLPPATCRGGNVTLPAPVTGIPCDLDCGSGYSLDISGSVPSCAQCSAGKYSIDGGRMFQNPWETIPNQFSYYCNKKKESSFWVVDDNDVEVLTCNPWRAMGEFLDSGDNMDIHNIESTLELQFRMVKKGKISFEYKFDAEASFDIFAFFADGALALNQEVPVLDKWANFSHELGTGHHVVEWKFTKDTSKSAGLDKAFIRSIRLEGLEFNDLQCLECPVGRVSAVPGASQCEACPIDSVAIKPGQTACDQCKPWERAVPGSGKCSPDVGCTDKDYAITYSPCRYGQRTVHFDWIQPSACATSAIPQYGEAHVGDSTTDVKTVDVKFFIPYTSPPDVSGIGPVNSQFDDEFASSAQDITTVGFKLRVERTDPDPRGGWGQDLKFAWQATSDRGVSLPADENRTCLPPSCKAGQRTDPVTGQCDACPRGTVSADGTGQCVACSAGQGASDLHWYVGEWREDSAVSERFTTSCTGDCGVPGWRFGGEFVDSGANHGATADSELILALDETVHGVPQRLKLDYALSCAAGSAIFEVVIDGVLVASLDCGTTGCDETPKELNLDLSDKIKYSKDGMHRIRWVYRKITDGDFHHNCDYVRLFSLDLGSDTPKSPVSLPAPALVGGSQCKTCSEGFFSNAEAPLCSACSPGSFSASQAATNCQPCAGDSFSNAAGATKCLQCGKGTSANEAKSECLFNCTYTTRSPKFEAPVTFDVSFMGSGVLGPVPVSPQLNFFFSLCQKFNTSNFQPWDEIPETCTSLPSSGWAAVGRAATGDNALGSHACVVKTGEDGGQVAASAGSIAGYDLDASGALVLDYTMGAAAMPCRDASGQETTDALTSSVTLICDLNSWGWDLVPTNGDGNPEQDADLPYCKSTFEWRSYMACRQCGDMDYVATDGECDADTKTKQRTYSWKETLCLGGELPPDEVVDCVPVRVVKEGDTVLSSGAIAAIVMCGILLFGVSLAAVVYTQRKKKALEEENLKLRHYVSLAGDDNIPDVRQMTKLKQTVVVGDSSDPWS